MKDSEFYFDWAKHEDNTFTSRGNFFLVSEALLLAALAALSGADMHYAGLIVVCAGGVIVTVLWLVVNVRHIYKTQIPIKQKLTEAENAEQNKRWSAIAGDRASIVPNHIIMGVILPIAVFAVWAALFVILIITLIKGP